VTCIFVEKWKEFEDLKKEEKKKKKEKEKERLLERMVR